MSECKDKLWFSSAKLAKQKIRRLKSKLNKKLKAYHCPECGGYHMTSKTDMGYQIKARSSE